MAAIRENRKNGKIISYRFTLCLERDAQGKQIRRYTTWTPPESLTPAKAKKAAERAADAWEDETRRAYQEEQKALACGAAYHLPPEKRHDDFCAFVNEIWFPLHICGNCKPTTTAYYKNIAKVIADYFKGCVLQEISPIQIQKYLIYLQTKYKTPQGKPLAPKSVRHHYGTLTNIFGYADKQEMLVKNPMQRVDAPKKVKKAIDALTPEQAKQFFALLPSCNLDFRCMLHLFITTGIRRGECMGIQWQDMQQPHMNAAHAFGVTTKLVSLQNLLEIRRILCLTRGSLLLGGKPRIIAGTGNARDLTQLGYCENVRFFHACVPDDAEFEAAIFHAQVSESVSSGCRISFFKNAICC